MKKEMILERIGQMKIGVLYGGLSNEREVSLSSGQAVIDALTGLDVNVVGIDMGRDVAIKIMDQKIDMAFIALHGEYGEDGCVQGTLEILGIPYTGSGVRASAVSMDKVLSKSVAGACGALVPEYRMVSAVEKEKDISNMDMHAPLVVKPVNGGSSLGITICTEDSQIAGAIDLALENDDRALIETFVAGRLLTFGIVGREQLPAIEIETKVGFYDYESKYTPGATFYHIPAKVDDGVTQKLADTALKIHDAIGVRGMSRTEFILDDKGQGWFLEINTIPGFTPTSLLPKGAKAIGMSFEELTLNIINEALPV